MKEIKNILICGAGMMGKNIGYVFASNPDFQVGLYDLYPTDVEAGIRTNTKQLLDKGVITEQELSDRLSRISTAKADRTSISAGSSTSRPSSRLTTEQCSASASGSSRDTSGNPAPRSHLLIVRSEI